MRLKIRSDNVSSYARCYSGFDWLKLRQIRQKRLLGGTRYVGWARIGLGGAARGGGDWRRECGCSRTTFFLGLTRLDWPGDKPRERWYLHERHVSDLPRSDLNIPITMIRGRGKFQRSAYPNIDVSPTDEGDVLEAKWKKWYQRESWKR